MTEGFPFIVKLLDQPLESFEQVAVVGDHEKLGSWEPQNAIVLKRSYDHRIWTGAADLPTNCRICYRYFIAAVDKETNVVQVRRWETHLTGRQLVTSCHCCRPKDTFGFIVPGQRSVQRGYLNVGHVVQFKVLPDELEIKECQVDRNQLRLKVQPVERNLQTPILPSSRAFTECVRMNFGDSYMQTQPEFGLPYRRDDMLVFHTRLSDLEAVAYLVKLFVQKPDVDLVDLIAYQYIYPESLLGSEGSFRINLISPSWLSVLGILQLHYLIIAPPENVPLDMSKTFVDYWPPQWNGMDAGHRGLGKSFHIAENPPPCIENTLASIKAVGDLGADMVEFDVQLSSDLVPLVYHDFQVNTAEGDKEPETEGDFVPLLLKNATYEQLMKTKIYHEVNGQICEYPAPKDEPEEDQRLFARLEDFLTQAPKSLGFDIEVKWPQQKIDGSMESFQDIDKNTYVDSVLEVVQRCAPGRFCFFSCFDADLCTMLRYKQNLYPVMYIVSDDLYEYADPRGRAMECAINHAQSVELAGLVAHAAHVDRDPGLVGCVLGQKQKLFLWFCKEVEAKKIANYKRLGVTGLIYDRMDRLVPPCKKSVFATETNLEYVPAPKFDYEHSSEAKSEPKDDCAAECEEKDDCAAESEEKDESVVKSEEPRASILKSQTETEDPRASVGSKRDSKSRDSLKRVSLQ